MLEALAHLSTPQVGIFKPSACTMCLKIGLRQSLKKRSVDSTKLPALFTCFARRTTMKRNLLSGFMLSLLCAAFGFAVIWRVAASDCGNTSTGLVPLTELGSGYYQGKQGGLYPDGA